MSLKQFPPSLPERGKFSNNMSSGTTVASSSPEKPQHPQHVFTASGIVEKKTAPTPIYNWESDSAKVDRKELIIGKNKFVPSNFNSIYTTLPEGNSKDNNEQLCSQYVDFQVVLTKEEMEVLAARRKKLYISATANAQNLSSINCTNKAVHKSHAASMSLHKSTPYIDPKRIQRELLIRR